MGMLKLGGMTADQAEAFLRRVIGSLDAKHGELPVNPMTNNELMLGGGGLVLDTLGKNLWLKSLRSLERGGGRRALTSLLEDAVDPQAVTVQLVPEPFATPAGKKMAAHELADWYRQFGFDFKPGIINRMTMIRTQK